MKTCSNLMCFTTITKKKKQLYRLFLFGKFWFPLKEIITEDSHYQLAISLPIVCNGASPLITFCFISKDRQLRTGWIPVISTRLGRKQKIMKCFPKWMLGYVCPTSFLPSTFITLRILCRHVQTALCSLFCFCMYCKFHLCSEWPLHSVL